MPTYIEMPKLSDTMTEGTLIKWLKKVGDNITVGDALAEIETDKATMEMEAFDDGKLGEIYVEAGGRVAVGEKLAVLLGGGEKAPKNGAVTRAVSKAENASAPAPSETSEPAPASTPAAPEGSSADRLKASPLARKLAAEKSIDLSKVAGSGPGGRIVEKDVISHSSGSPSSEASQNTPKAIALSVARSGQTRVPLTGMRKVIAERLVTSKTTIPHFYLGMEVDASPLLDLRRKLNLALEKAGLEKLTINDFVLKAVAEAVVQVPKINASWDGDAIIEYGSVDISVAVAIDDGLITPVIRNAQAKTLRQISGEMKDLASRARSKKLKPEEYQGGTITVSSLGPFGIESFYAIVNPPQAVILAIGSIVKKAVVGDNDAIIAGNRMTIGFSADHRVVDGAVGAAFLVELRKYLEQPTLALI